MFRFCVLAVAIAGSITSSLCSISIARESSGTSEAVLVVQASKDIPMGNTLLSKDLEIKVVSKSNCPNDAFDDFSVALYRSTKANLRKGQIIRLRDFGLAPVAKLYRSPTTVLSKRKAQNLKFEDRLVPIVYCKGDIAAGTIIEPTDLGTRKILESKCPPKVVGNPYTAIGRRTTRKLNRGEFIWLPAIGLNLTRRKRSGV